MQLVQLDNCIEDLFFEVIERPETFITDNVLKLLAKRRMFFRDPVKMFETVVKHPTVTRERFEEIYDKQLTIEHHEAEIQYHENAIKRHRQELKLLQ